MQLRRRGLHKALEVLVREGDGVGVGSRLADDGLVLGERRVHPDRQPVEVAERRHGPQLAAGEHRAELVLSRKADILRPKRRFRRRRAPPIALGVLVFFSAIGDLVRVNLAMVGERTGKKKALAGGISGVRNVFKAGWNF